ncbi:hypothetical protein ACWTQY_27080, partial [Klebsiella pneumoniae]
MLAAAGDRLAREALGSLRRVFNLTGTVLHTNLGRALMAEAAARAAYEASVAFANLEFDLDTGRRGERDAHVRARLCRLTGAEAATVVNNNAGNGDTGLAALLKAGQVRKMICSFPRQSDSWVFDGLYR